MISFLHWTFLIVNKKIVHSALDMCAATVYKPKSFTIVHENKIFSMQRIIFSCISAKELS